MGKEPRTSAKPRYCRRCLPQQLLSACAHSKQHRNSKNLNPPISTEPPTPSPPSKVLTNPFNSLVNCQTSTPPSCLINVIDPQLLDDPCTESQAADSLMDAATSISLEATDASDTESIDLGHASPSTPVSCALRVRVSHQNPVHGAVEGAMRGNFAWVIPRTKPLREVELQASPATKRFAREIANIFSRCERLSAETGCWLFIGAQHAHANTPFVHFASARIRRDASKELNDVASRFSIICSSLIAARRQDALIMAQKLAIAENDRQAAESALQQQKAQLNEKDALIAHYENLLGKAA